MNTNQSYKNSDYAIKSGWESNKNETNERATFENGESAAREDFLLMSEVQKGSALDGERCNGIFDGEVRNGRKDGDVGNGRMDDDVKIGTVDHAINVREEIERVKFSSTFSTYMTLLGFSLGMSDFWRFPFLAYRNGGGAFLIPFMIMILVCGFPLFFLEYSLAQFSGRGPYKIWDVCPLFRGIGVTVVGAYSLWMIGTSVLRCWIIDILVNSFRDPLVWTNCDNPWNTPHCREANTGMMDSNMTTYPVLNNDTANLVYNISTTAMNTVAANIEQTMSSTEEFWQYRVLELSSGMSDLSPIQWRHVMSMAGVRVVIFLGLIKSIKSIEKVIYVTATVPFFLTVAIFIRSLMLPGSTEGILHFITPEFEKIAQPRVWIEATLMAFYTMGFGWGGNMLLASHADFKQNCVRMTIVLPLASMISAMFSGLVCFSVLGNMAYTNNVQFVDVISGGLSTGIVAYITALSSLPLPQLWTACYLIAIILTGIDGQLVPMDMLMQLIGDLVPRVRSNFRIQALVVVGVIFFLCSLPTCTGGGAYIFLWMDWYNGAWIGPVVAFIQLIVVAWIYGMDRFNKDVQLMIGRDIPATFRFSMAFLAPLAVLVIFITSILEYVPPEYGSYTYSHLARGMGWFTVVLGMSPIIIYAGYLLYTLPGTISQKLSVSTRPNSLWGPSELEFIAEYDKAERKLTNRTFKQLFYYNIFGSKGR